MKSWRALFLHLLLFTLLASTSWSAPVLIYKGTGKQVGKSDGVISGPVSVYLIIDPATRQVGILYFYIRNKQKLKFALAPGSYRRVEFPLDTGKTSGVYHQTFVLDAVENYIVGSRTLRGTYTGLKTSSEAVSPFLHPKLISGVEVVFADTDDTQASSDLRFNVTFQKKQTIDANDANRTVLEVYAGLVEELTSKGY